MKILFVCDPVLTSNPYVSTLVEGLVQQKIEAKMSCDDFWINDNYDIIHFQWPEAVYKWSQKVTVKQIHLLKDRISILKNKGKKIVSTCHNLRPHVAVKNDGIDTLYQIIYEYSDLIIHMGSYSYQLLSAQYCHSSHVIIPHHIYDNIYHFMLDKKECQDELGIDSSKINILCFGEFRTDAEREFIISLRNFLNSDEIDFIVPGFFRKKFFAKTIAETCRRIYKIFIYKRMGLKFKSKLLDNTISEKYFTACDLVLIQRLAILNSGNLPMGFHAGRVVVGVDDGNVGCILKETGNPTFAANDFKSAINAIKQAIQLAKSGWGQKNRQLAESKWNTAIISERLIKEYVNLLHQN